MKKPLIIFNVFIILTFCITSQAANISDCRTIANDQKRLVCYDQLVIEENNLSAEIENRNQVVTNDINRPASENTSSNKPQEYPGKIITKKESTITNDDFGLRKENNNDIISTSILGEFSGWDKKTKFKLANGQTWKVNDSGTRSVYRRKMNNPKVTISKGFFNSYKMNVEGVNSSVKVKRIK